MTERELLRWFDERITTARWAYDEALRYNAVATTVESYRNEVGVLSRARDKVREYFRSARVGDIANAKEM